MFGMRMDVEDTKETEDRIVVVTTGFRVVVDKKPEEGQILCYQRLGRERLLGKIDVQGSLKGKLTRRGLPCEISAQEGLYADMPWANYHYVPRDADGFHRVVATAHRLGMKVLPYMSPYHGIADGDAYQEKIGMVLEEYGVDGVYFDELLVGNNVKEAYATITETRKRHGEILLYVHCTGTNRYMYCPSIDTYADCILRAEHFYPFDSRYLRYVISSFDIANTIGYVCCAGDYPVDFTRRLGDACLSVGARLPYFVGSDYEGDYAKLMEQEYFPKLDRLGRGEQVDLNGDLLMDDDDRQFDEIFVG